MEKNFLSKSFVVFKLSVQKDASLGCFFNVVCGHLYGDFGFFKFQKRVEEVSIYCFIYNLAYGYFPLKGFQ